MISSVFTPAGSEASQITRPGKLIAAIRRKHPEWGAEFYGHGRSVTIGTRISWPDVARNKVPGLASPNLILSPFFLGYSNSSTIWIDLYDDWSLAPEFRHSLRIFANFQYLTFLKRGMSAGTVLTVNSLYMRDRFSSLAPRLLPNAADRPSELGAITTRARSSEKRLFLIGNFRPGRTDYALARRLLSAPGYDRCFIVSPDERLRRIAFDLRDHRVQVLAARPWDEIGALFTSRSVVAVPNLVTDYTLSQDPLKFYQAGSLGIRTLIPFELVAPWMDPEFFRVFSPGVAPESVLAETLSTAPPSPDAVDRFVNENSWDARVRQLEDWGVRFAS